MQRKAVAVQKQCTCSKKEALEYTYFKTGKGILGEGRGDIRQKGEEGIHQPMHILLLRSHH